MCCAHVPVLCAMSLSEVFSVVLENYSAAKLAQLLGKIRMIIKEMLLSCLIPLLATAF